MKQLVYLILLGVQTDASAETTAYRVLTVSLVVILVAVSVALWRLAIAHLHLFRDNRELFEMILRNQHRQERDSQRKGDYSIQKRRPNQQLFARICELMRKEQLYTDAELNRDTLAARLGTNHRYVDEAIRECANKMSTNAFINSYRVDHAARLLAETDDPIALIAEMSGFANRTSFNNLFRERFKMTPSEARRAAQR